MATQTLDYATYNDICCGTLPASIIICVPFDIVAAPSCTDSEEDQTYERSYIEGSLVSRTCQKIGCQTRFIYTISIDDSQLIEDHTLVGSEIISVFCETCATQWVKDLVGNEVYISTDDDGNQTLVSSHGCEYPITVLDSVAWIDWTPTLTADGSMTFTGTSIARARYAQIGKVVMFQIEFTGTVGGTPSTNLQFTLPVTAASTSGLAGGAVALNPGNVGGYYIPLSTSQLAGRLYDSSAWSAGSGRGFRASGLYEAA